MSTEPSIRTPVESSLCALQVNGEQHDLSLSAEVSLMHVLRNDLALNGPKYGCGLGSDPPYVVVGEFKSKTKGPYGGILAAAQNQFYAYLIWREN